MAIFLWDKCGRRVGFNPRFLWGLAAGLLGALLLSYCVYFDRKRRKDPNYLKKVKERRKAYRVLCQEKDTTVFPDMSDQEAVKRFFLQEVKLGEELLGKGDVDGGIGHLANAVTICGEPNKILEILQQTLPPNLFLRLLQKLPSSSQKVIESGQREIQYDE